ncbi:hypothetical protein [Burkholderia ubonensis]|uniref:hypothetical protein n=1 Tax=Burkholderia ubonensis TaxID=101571 RepID=UPI00075864EA|nr:hypothetical protein [Burkholderia ubonensis]KVP39611.1 hypothetical protein WJ87_05095 [Burkholderia ubonensis]
MNLPEESQLLSREDFKRFVFLRARGRCVFCPAPAVDAHHVLERKLFEDGGYYLGNGAAVCDAHHWKCETTELSVEAVRAAAGIRSPALPLGFAADKTYDKWGNELREDGCRVAGPLAEDDGMLRALTRGRVRHLLISAGA